MSILTKLRKHFEDRDKELLRILKQYVPDDEPAYEDPPPKPRPTPKGTPGSQEWYRSLPPPRSDPRDISMNALARFIPKREILRGPHSQSRRFNGRWGWWE
jgi:hypothetical protein